MCLATPVRIKSQIANRKSQIVVEGNRMVDISLVPDAKRGDWLLCHGNLAINKIDQKEAKDILRMIKQCSHRH